MKKIKRILICAVLITVCFLLETTVFQKVIYVLLFMLKSDFHFLHYLRHVIMPELVYTILVTLVLYQIILHINRRLEEEEKRSASRFV